ncbi:MAG TPA: C69 family dipeptidase, partial [Williamwhitmania sp.]|nr:C69 family dipeptidase [Williamwhitmania sp.]
MKHIIFKASVALTLGLFAISSASLACTNFLITKGASADGSTILSYSADSHTLYGELYHWSAQTYPAGTMMNIYEWDTGKLMGQIAQAAQTYNVVGNMNEYQVTIGETTFGGKEELRDTTATVDYGSLIYLALQRSKTAREAIKVMADLVAQYGYASEGESFSIGDPNEVWILEMVGKGTKM